MSEKGVNWEMICEKCGKQVSETAEFCKDCGHKLKTKPRSQNMFCGACGSKNFKDSKFCKDCGEKLFEEAQIKQKADANNNDNTFECEHCGKGFVSEIACLKHEKNCSERTTKCETISNPQQESNSIRQKKSNAWVVIVVVIIIVIAAFGLMSMYGQQQHAASFVGQTESILDKIFG